MGNMLLKNPVPVEQELVTVQMSWLQSPHPDFKHLHSSGFTSA